METSYKEKYEQAIERLKQWDREHPCAGFVLSDRDKFIFPELAESEDEKMRKALIGELNTYFDKDTKIDGFSIERIIAWLEKQGEQKPEENKGNIGGISANWSEEDERNLQGIIDEIEANKNQAPDCDLATYDRFLSWLKSLKCRVQPQPKQEWKQENTGDLTAFENAMMHIGGSFFGQHAGLDPNDTKSIKEQANLLLELVPSKEWSEEDKQHIRTIIHAIHGAGNITPIDGELAEDWLKSLRPQNRWKPSDEQIGLLQAIINEPNNASSESCQIVLKDILEQLKKLRG